LLGFSSGASNRINVNDTLEVLSSKLKTKLIFDSNDQISFSINNKVFTFDKNTTLNSMMSAINGDSTANVRMVYDETTDTFSITAKQLGAGETIDIQNISGNFFGASGASGIDTAAEGCLTKGEDALVNIDGVMLTRSSNTFKINGLIYTLKGVHTDPENQSETVGLIPDTESVYKNIEAFVNAYNDLIASLNSIIGEKYDRNYQPLTSEQKKEMSEDEIEAWEKKAKTGLLANDQNIQNMLYEMRTALQDKVSGLNINLSAIGIKTGSYSDKGKLIIDKETLMAAIEADPVSVSELFCRKSSSTENNIDLSSEEAKKRYEEEGLMQRINDILNNYIRTTRDSNGNKGILLEKAGMAGDSTEYSNLIQNEIEGLKEQIKTLTERLTERENYYFKKFGVLESYIAQMNAQASYILSMFSSEY